MQAQQKRAGKVAPVFMPNVVTIELLLKYYYMGNEPSTNSQALQEAKSFLLRHGLIEGDDDEMDIVITEKGKHWVDFVLTKCPLPQTVSVFRVYVPEDAS